MFLLLDDVVKIYAEIESSAACTLGGFCGVLLVDQMVMGRFQYVKLAVNVLDVATHRQRLLTEYRK